VVIERSLDVRAARIPDSVDKLRYLRSELSGRPRCWLAPSALGLLLAGLLVMGPTQAKVSLLQPPPRQVSGRFAQTLAKPWIVERYASYLVYSNGLQIRMDYTAASAPRRYITRSLETLSPSPIMTVPAGIVYHTTESLLLPLEANQNGPLIHTREDLLRHVRNERLYNFLIDRFGQVFRIVPEDQVAHHAGYSVWADKTSIYEGLNESFLGVSFEARTGVYFAPTVAQVRSGRMLTDMLRATYGIAESNCVTHAQVSVNPDNMRVGYHTDWGARFPFHEFGLSTGYDSPIAAIAVFGFQYDETFLKAIGGRPWEGLLLAEDRILRDAAKHGLMPSAYRDQLQQQYRMIRSHSNEHATAADRT
jgi:hypothetical protein